MAALNMPLNVRQLEVLRWIGDGRPAREATDSTYKIVAVALQNRRLITISKKGGQWSAVLLDAGRYYLDHGEYPDGHLKPKKQRADQPKSRTTRRGATGSGPPPVPAQSQVVAAKTPPAMSPSQQLIHDINEAGGTLTRNIEGADRNYAGLVSAINLHGMAPEGQHLVMNTGTTYYEKIFRFEALPAWVTTAPREVVAAPRIGRWHRSVAQLRDQSPAMFRTEVRSRGLRILHAIAVEAEARGHRVEVPTKVSPSGGRYAYKETGQLLITIASYRFFVSVLQRDDYTAHIPTPEELEKQKRSEWNRPPRWDISPGHRLWLRIYGVVAHGWEQKWSDSKTLKVRIEDHLADAMRTMESSVRRDEDRKDAELRERENQARRRDAAEKLVGGRHAEIVRAEVLDQQFAAWLHTRGLREYLEAMAERLATITDADSRAAATEWLRWCERYVDSHDPLQRALAMPLIRPPTWQEHSSLMREIMAELP